MTLRHMSWVICGNFSLFLFNPFHTMIVNRNFHGMLCIYEYGILSLYCMSDGGACYAIFTIPGLTTKGFTIMYYDSYHYLTCFCNAL